MIQDSFLLLKIQLLTTMSRTYRRQSYYIFRAPQTFNELKQQQLLDDEYIVSTRHRYIPTIYDDIHISAVKELDHHQ